ncbi:tyrosine-type recombinase/integrase [Litorivivens sp.]|uniref:tyrosine-type recombinase/integrase n=1 Tax=Litorivivens sp. TaxID=2020868 RepID=UPI003564CD9A
MASIRKDGKRWRAEVRKSGQYHSKTFPSKMQAKAWADEIESSIHKSVGKSDYTLKDALKKFLTDISSKRKGHRQERVFLTRLMDTEIASETFKSVTPAHIKEWRDSRLEKVSAATVNREMNVLSAVFQAGIEWEWTTENVVRQVKRPQKPRPRDRRPTEDEIDRVVMALGFDGDVETKQHEIAVAYLLAIETAMRLGEICGIRKEHIHLDERYIALPDTKNGTSRNVPLSKEAVRLIKLVPDGFTITPGPSSVVFKKACKRAQIEGLTFHDSRREALTRLSKKVGVMELAKISGHKDLKTLLTVYYAPTATDLAAMLD